jgi:hypothetical protein
MGILSRHPSKKDVIIQALEVQVMELKAAAEKADAARRYQISEIMSNSNKQVSLSAVSTARSLWTWKRAFLVQNGQHFPMYVFSSAGHRQGRQGLQPL